MKFSLREVIKQHPKLVQTVVSLLRVCPPLLGYVRRTLFYANMASHFPASLIGEDVDRDKPYESSSRNIFVDVSATTRYSNNTGLSRVAKQTLKSLAEKPPSSLQIVPVYSDGRKFYRFRKTEHFRLKQKKASFRSSHEEIKAYPGDIVILLDIDIYYIPEMEPYLHELRQNGVALYAVVCDLIPALYPDFAPEDFVKRLPAWLGAILRQVDGAIGISRAVAVDLKQWIDHNPPKRQSPLKIGYFHIGADFLSKVPDPEPAGPPPRLNAPPHRPSILMVSTIEPRKGYTQALAAFEQLWTDGTDVNLVIVGREGWKMSHLIHKLRTHPEAGHRLFWFDNINDQALNGLYKSCIALLAASVTEGFGLPLVEAAQHELPVIARDIPVFRETMEDQAYYFSGDSPEELADALKSWLALLAVNTVPRPTDRKWLSWEQSAQCLMALVLDGHDDGWLFEWRAGTSVAL
jgi:glycosyltransferase involved in cell wall biosynthesis